VVSSRCPRQRKSYPGKPWFQHGRIFRWD